MNSRQIEIFHTVMQAGTVTDAAAKLGVSQPAVTTSLKQMEAALGLNLFHRANGRLHPTAEALILFEEATRIQDSLIVFKKLAERLRSDLTAHVRVVTPAVFALDLIPETIARFAEENADCLIDATTAHHDQILHEMASSGPKPNLAITFGYDGRAGIGATPIGTSPLKALVPSSSPLAVKRSLTQNDFEGIPLVGTFPGEPLGDAVEQFLTGLSTPPVHVARVHNHSVAANLANKGVGTAIVDSITAQYAASYYAAGTLRILDIEGPSPLAVTALHSHAHPLNANSKRFIDLFRRIFREA